MLFEYQILRFSTLNEQNAKQINIKGTRYSEIIIKCIKNTSRFNIKTINIKNDVVLKRG